MQNNDIEILVEGASRKWCEMHEIDPEKWRDYADDMRAHITRNACVRQFVIDENAKRAERKRVADMAAKKLLASLLQSATDNLTDSELIPDKS